ncbi:MAG: ATP-dependent sacrificial sulfur transferase LarE, partial [Verrucomicrobiota bacterium]|nr:ATP-dependent sacrificial sulfur transferase LarE [Verrucomicrobiota bacterium]
MTQTLEKLEALKSKLHGMGRVLLAYSGGVDSSFLLKVAHDCLGANCLGIIADSPSIPRRELDDAVRLAKEIGAHLRIVKTGELENGDYADNPPNRCYFCKHELFDQMTQIAQAEKWDTLVYGEMADDVGDFRPGAAAAVEFAVRAPLKEVGMTKVEIRALSKQLDLPTADKPAMACLSSRIPHGEPVTQEVLGMIEMAEEFLSSLGFHEFRVRHHRMSGNGMALARLELAPDELARATDPVMRGEIAA